MSFDVELWDGFDLVAQRVSDGKAFNQEVQAWFRKRSEIERDYAKKLSELCQTKSKITEVGTLGACWNTIKTETDSLSKAHQALSETLITNIEVQIKNWVTSSGPQRKALKQNGNKLSKAVVAARKEAATRKTRYEEGRKRQDAVEIEMATNPKVAKKLDTEKKGAQRMDAEYKEKIKLLTDLENKFYDTEMPAILRDMEQLDRERIDKLGVILQGFLTIQATIWPAEKSAYENMESAIKSIDATSDLKKFISTTKTGNNPPPRIEYEPYDPSVGACIKNPSSTSLSSSVSSRPPSSAVSNPNPNPNPVLTSSNSNPNLMSSPAPSSPGPGVPTPGFGSFGRGTANAPMGGQRLAPSGARTIAVGPAAANGGGRGMGGPGAGGMGGPAGMGGGPAAANAGGRGMGGPGGMGGGPATANGGGRGMGGPGGGMGSGPPSRQPPPNPPRRGVSVIGGEVNDKKIMVAKYGRAAEEDGELTFQEGDEITVLSEDPSGWWEGELKGVKGTFPFNYCEEKTAAAAVTAAPAAEKSGTRRCRVKYRYESEAGDELTVNEGEVFDVEEEDDEGWYYGTNSRGERGKFPGNYCDIIT